MEARGVSAALDFIIERNLNTNIKSK
jgi:hypothetical protein